MPEKDLPTQILEYLKGQKATYQKVDIGLPFLENDDSTERRQELRQALDYLVAEGFIVLTGETIHMLWKQANQHPSKYHTELKASITKLGEKEIEPPKEPIVPVTHHVHIENATSPIVNSPISQSSLNIDNSLDKQTNTNINPNKPIKRSWIELLYWIAGIIVGSILIYEFIIKHLKWV